MPPLPLQIVKCIAWVGLHLAGLIVILGCAAGLACPLLGRIRFHSALERFVFTIALGLGGLSLVVFVLGAIGILEKRVLIGLSVVLSLSAAWHLRRSLEGWFRAPLRCWRDRTSSARPAAVATVAGLTLYWVLLMVSTQYPPTHWDATSNHLVLARHFLAEHRFSIHDGIPQPVLPAMAHSLFAWGLALYDDLLAQMIEHTYLVLTALGLYSWAKREKKAALGAAAAGIWLAHSLVLWLGQSAYVDAGVTCYAVLGVYSLWNLREEVGLHWWYIGSAAMAFCAATKLTGLFFVGLGGAMGLWLVLRGRLRRQAFGLGLALFVILASPWYGLIAFHTGNPVWPMLAGWSKGVWADPSVIRAAGEFTGYGIPRTLLNFVLFPFEAVANPRTFQADANRTLFPVIAALPVSWLACWWSRSARWWTLWAMSYTIFWFVASQQLRHLLPALPMLGLAICLSVNAGLEKIRGSRRVRQFWWAGVAVAAFTSSTVTTVSGLIYKGLPPVGPTLRHYYLSRMYGGYRGVRYLNQRIQDGDAVYMIYGSWLNYYVDGRAIDRAGLLQRSVWPVFSWPEDERWLERLREQGVEWIFVYHGAPPKWMGLPEDRSVWRPQWPGYNLVYDEGLTWVFRRSR